MASSYTVLTSHLIPAPIKYCKCSDINSDRAVLVISNQHVEVHGFHWTGIKDVNRFLFVFDKKKILTWFHRQRER